MDSFWCQAAYFFTASGGPIGFSVLLLLTGLFYASSHKGFKKKTLVFFRSITAIGLLFMLLALLNERYTKHFLKMQRPSHVFMLEETGRSGEIDSLYTLSDEGRRMYFEDLVRSNQQKFQMIDRKIVAHWLEESGFSFPSGHSFVAFLFAMILAYAIYFTRSRPRWRKLFMLPFVWALLVAVSRVAVGAHTALDVTAGAAMGM